MKKFSKILTLLLTIVLVLSNARAINALPTPGEDKDYDPINGGTTDFNKYLITNEGQTIPTLEFEYTIEPGTAVSPKGGSPEKWTIVLGDEEKIYTSLNDALAGIQEWNSENPTQTPKTEEDLTYVPAVKGLFEIYAGYVKQWEIDYDGDIKVYNSEEEAREDVIAWNLAHPTKQIDFDNEVIINEVEISTAKFGENDPYNHQKWDKLQPDDDLDQSKLVRGKVYSKDNVEVDLSKIIFTEPGIYRYIITEKEIEDYSIENINYDIEQNTMKRVLDIYVIEDPSNPGVLKVETRVLHNTKVDKVKSTVYTTGDMGSIDENVVAWGWAISTDMNDDGTFDEDKIFNTKKEADDELYRRRTVPGTDPNYDSALLALQEQIDTKNSQISAKQAEYNTAASRLQPPLGEEDGSTNPSRYKNLRDAEKARDVLYEGADDKTGTIKDLLAAATNKDDTSQDPALYKHGKNALMDYLETSTDAKEIFILRRVISNLDRAITTADNRVNTAQNSVNEALNSLKSIQNDIDELNLEKQDLEKQYQELVKRHNDAKVLEVRWRLSDKSTHYTNEISTHNLEFGKEVEGNQGSKDKYFKFTLELSGLRAPQSSKWGYGNVKYDTKAEAIAAAESAGGTADDVEYYPPVPGSVVTINSESSHIKYPTKNIATKYSTDVMQADDANPRDDLPLKQLIDLNEEEARDYIWLNGSDSYFYNFDLEKWFKDGDPAVEVNYDDIPDSSTTGTDDVQELVADKDGKIKWTVYLKDGEYIVIKDLKAGIHYEVTEEKEDYEMSTGTKEPVKIGTEIKKVYIFNGIECDDLEDAEADARAAVKQDKITGEWEFAGKYYDTRELAEAAAIETIVEKDKIHDDKHQGTLDKNIYTGYTNTRNGIIPTGVMAAAGTGALIVGAGILGLVAMNRRREEDDEEE